MLLDDLAECYRLQARDAEAEQLYQQALTIWEQRLGPSNLNVTISLQGLANLARDRDQYLEAEQYYQRALHLREQQLGQHHVDTAHLLHDLALLRQKQGQLNEACELAERALSIREQALGETHPHTGTTRTLHAQLAQEQERHPREEAASADVFVSAALAPHRQEDLPTMHVAVRRGSEQVVYTRTVSMRAVTFTCTTCGQTVTQLHYPSGRLKYCSDACRAASVAGRQEARVARQREKRRRTRDIPPQTPQE